MTCLRSSKDIEQAIADLDAEAIAIAKTADEEKRELNSKEKNRVDAIYGTDEETDPGEIGKLRAELKTAQIREKHQEQIKSDARRQLRPELERHVQSSGVQIGSASDVFSQIVVPRTAQRRKAEHFDSMQEAYACGKWLQAVILEDEDAQQFCRDNGIPIQAAMSTGDSQKGGFLVPEPLEASIIRIVEERGVFRRFARDWPMAAPVDHHPRRESGVTAYWVGENEEVTASDPKLGDVELVAKCLAALTTISKRLNATSVIQIADFITQEMAYAIADKEDEAGFNGDGTSTYGGVTGVVNALNAGSIVDAASGNVSFATLDNDDFLNCAAQMKDVTGANPRWFISKKGYHKSMGRLKTAAGGNTKADIAAGADQMYDGDDVIFTNVLPKTDAVSTIQAVYGDLSMAATLGRLMGFSVESNNGGEYFKKLQIAIVGYEDVAINVHQRGTATEGGVLIGLKTAAS